MTVIACQQLAPRIKNLAHNVELSTNAVREASAAGADIIVLPELITCGYMFDSREEIREVAINKDHEVFKLWKEAAGQGKYVVGGFAENGPEGSVWNSLAIVGEDIETTIYHKIHLWDHENAIFTKGGEEPPVIKTKHGILGAIICYDLEFPELTRNVASRGAQLLAVPTNWPLVERPKDERPPEVIIGMAAARVNRMAIACADRAGRERGQDWTEGTTIIGSDGWVAADSSNGTLVMADLDLNLALDKQISKYNNLFTDRHPEIYS